MSWIVAACLAEAIALGVLVLGLRIADLIHRRRTVRRWDAFCTDMDLVRDTVRKATTLDATPTAGNIVEAALTQRASKGAVEPPASDLIGPE